MKPRKASRGRRAIASASATASRGAAPLLLAADIDLHAHVEGRQLRIVQLGKPLRNADSIGCLDPCESPRGQASLVALQRSDHMPLDIREVGKGVGLRNRLLNIILAKRALTEPIDRANGVRREAFADGEQPYLVRIPPRHGRSGGDSREDCLPRLLV
jgi:hypothetical protein